MISPTSNSAWRSFHHCGAQCLIDTGLPARAGRPKPGQQILVEPDCDPFLVASLGTANTPGAPCFALREGLFDRGVADIEIFRVIRSEEHTSELQSLMRISYAVFCLKKKKKSK